MFRLVLMILVALPMLVPPGMCLCQFAPIANAEAGFPTETSHAAGRSDCRCDSCRKRATDDHDRNATPTDLPAPPEQRDHAPHCPAALGDLPTKMAVSTFAIDFDADLGFVSAVVEPTDMPAWNRDAVIRATTSPPLFISHCALVI